MRPVAGQVPSDAVGVYIAYRESNKPVSFLRVSPAGRWLGDPTLPLASLRARWVLGSPVVYIGKAGRPRPGSFNNLRKRVSAYVRFGAGSNARHFGGYPTWQLADAANLLVAWRIAKPPRTPSGLEGALVAAHIRRFEALPFANAVVPADGD